jgi:hypothetical protein
MLFARGPGCDNCLGKSAKIGIAGIKGRRLVGEILIPDQRICDLLRLRQYAEARRVWLTEMDGQPMSLAGYSNLLVGEIGVQEWVSYLGSAEELGEDLALTGAGRAER